jgi:hypothetical protein
LICIYEADQGAEILYEGVEMAEKAWKDKSWNEAIPAAISAFAFVQQLRQTIPVCEQVDPKKLDWTEFDKTVSALEEPALIENEVVLNGKTITKDIFESVEAWTKGDYVGFGEKWGNTLHLATQDNKNVFLY